MVVMKYLPAVNESVNSAWNCFPLEKAGEHELTVMLEAKKGFRRLKGYKQLHALRTALIAHHGQHQTTAPLLSKPKPRNLAYGIDRFAIFN